MIRETENKELKKYNFNVSLKIEHKDRYMKMDVLALDCTDVKDANEKAITFIKEHFCKDEYAGWYIKPVRTLISNIKIVIQ